MGAIFGTSAPYFIAGWKSDFRDQVKSLYTPSSYPQSTTSASSWALFVPFIVNKSINGTFFFIPPTSRKRMKIVELWCTSWSMHRDEELNFPSMVELQRKIIPEWHGNDSPLYSICGWTKASSRKIYLYLKRWRGKKNIIPPPDVISLSNPAISRFIDVPIESCGMASPLRVTLQAGAPDILLILLR